MNDIGVLFLGIFLVAFTVIGLSLPGILPLWLNNWKIPLTRKLVLSMAVGATSVALLFGLTSGVSLAYGRGHFRDNLKTYSELLETATPDAALAYTRLLKEKPLSIQLLKQQAEKEKSASVLR